MFTYGYHANIEMKGFFAPRGIGVQSEIVRLSSGIASWALKMLYISQL